MFTTFIVTNCAIFIYSQITGLPDVVFPVVNNSITVPPIAFKNSVNTVLIKEYVQTVSQLSVPSRIAKEHFAFMG